MIYNCFYINECKAEESNYIRVYLFFKIYLKKNLLKNIRL